MNITTNKEKERLINKHTPKSKVGKNCLLAFLFGGAICAAAEGMRNLFIYLGIDEKLSLTLVTLLFILIGSLSTALGFFDKIARHAGAGTLVPITGFSNAITSQAIDSKSEGFVLGVGSKIFTVSGPVILYGLASGIIYGIIYYILNFLIPIIMQ